MTKKNIYLIDFLNSAYRKLKSNSYYDNKNLFLKKRIVEFENIGVDSDEKYPTKNSLHKKLEKIQEILNNEKQVSFTYIESKNFNIEENTKNDISNVEFTIRSIPKSLKENSFDNKLITNLENRDEEIIVEKLMNYLDINIESHIIGTLWVMMIGKELENEYIDYAIGNILEDDIGYKNLNLFKPYYLSYEKWRDDAIKVIENRMDESESNRSTMISLDLKEYYYSINFDIKKAEQQVFEKYRKMLDKNNYYYEENKKKDRLIEIFRSVNQYVWKVIDEYSKVLDTKKKRLPIGFLPSNILSNWYLREFDESVNKKLNPLYYKRYVDDIIVVLNTNSEKKNKLKEKDFINEKFFDTSIFTIGVLKKDSCVVSMNNKKDFENFCKEIDRDEIKLKKQIIERVEESYFRNSNKDIEKDNPFQDKENIIYSDWNDKFILKDLDFDYQYVIKNIDIDTIRRKKVFILKEYEEKNATLIIQDKKVKIYDFVGDGSRALIDNFRKEIKKNASVFKFLPEKNEILESFDSEVYKLDYDDSIHKLSGIKSIDINKYNLSKFLARVIYSNKLEEVDYNAEVNRKIEWIFNGKKAIEYFFLWDKIFNYYLINEKYDLIFKCYLNIKKSINNINIEFVDFSLFNFEGDNKNSGCEEVTLNLKKDLLDYLDFTLAMNCALNDNMAEYIRVNVIRSKELFMFINRYKKYIRSSNMLKHSLVRNSLMNYYYLGCVECKPNIKINYCTLDKNNHEVISDNSRCFYTNYSYSGCLCSDQKKLKKCKEISEFAYDYNPRFVHIHECILNSIYNIISRGEIVSNGNEILEAKELFLKLNFGGFSDEKNNKSRKDIFANKYNIMVYNSINSRLKCLLKERGTAPKTVKEIAGEIAKEIENEIVTKTIKEKETAPKTIIEIAEKIAEKIEKERGNENYCKENNSKNEGDCFPGVTINTERICTRLRDTHFRYFDLKDYIFLQDEYNINYLEYGIEEKKDKIKIAIANIKTQEKNLIDSFKKNINLDSSRFDKLSELLNYSAKNEVDMIIFPEVSIPLEWISYLSNFSRKHDILIVCGLEHIIYDNKICCNYIATLIPDRYKNYEYSVIKLRLKNHYSPREKEWVNGYGWKLPHENGKFKKEYDLIRWKGIDFSSFSCFELANIQDRSLFTSYVDLLIGSVHNKDTNYYSNVMESLARDIHCYFVQVNDSNFGDNRIVKPSSTNTKNLLQISGGLNDIVLIEEIDIKKLRDFQLMKHNLQLSNKEFKPVPPEFKLENVKIREGMLL